MAESKLSAGRKMLIEFQKRKTEKKNPQTATSANVSPNVSTVGVFIEKNSNKIEPYQNLTQSGGQPPDQFFDDFVSITKNQNMSGKIEDEITLAGVLFTSQNNDNDPTTLQTYNEDDMAPGNTQPPVIQTDSVQNNEISLNHNMHDMRTLVEFSKLQQQLQFHVKTVEFLVSEKNNLSEKLHENEKTIDNLNAQMTDLTGRLNISRHRVSHLEAECNQLRHKNELTESQLLKLMNDSQNYQSIENTYKKQLRDVQEELNEMKNLMDDKVSDYKLLLSKYEEVNAQLQSNELRLQQVIRGDTDSSQSASLQEHCQNLEQMVNTLRQQLSQSESEKSHSSLHYQQYVQQLNNQVQALNEKQEELNNENERLQNREESLLQQMAALEKQLQSNMNHIPSQKMDKNMDEMKDKMQNLEKEITELKDKLQNKDLLHNTAIEENQKYQEYIEELTNNLQKLQSESPDISKLNAAIESDRLAAQQATLQNTKMKDDLKHLEKAFEQMTKSKLELAELLQAEKNLSKNLTLKLVETEEKLKETDTKLRAKDEEMIRLQSNSSALEKQLSKHVHKSNEANCCETTDKSLDILQTELENAKHTIQSLKNEKLKKSDGGMVRVEPVSENLTSNEMHATMNGSTPNNCDEPTANDMSSTNIPTSDAMKKLQEKFTKLMKEVADLSDEKQKLEHIVLQLQGETETICEYIALYQKQRSILKQREAERNIQLHTLSEERQNMKKQLDDLNILVAQLRNNEVRSENIESKSAPVITKIMDLVTEIKSNHLIEPNDNNTDLRNFNHCPCCSGKLITV